MSKHIYDKEFRYTPAAQTDIRKTFARVRREQKQLPQNVTPLKRKTK